MSIQHLEGVLARAEALFRYYYSDMAEMNVIW